MFADGLAGEKRAEAEPLEGADNLGPLLPDGFEFHSDIIMIAQ